VKNSEPNLLREVAGDAATTSELRLLGSLSQCRRQRALRRTAASLSALALAAALPFLPWQSEESLTSQRLAALPAPIAPAPPERATPATVEFLTDAQLLDLFADRGAILVTYEGGRQELRLARR
jgi:hypothetical protein